ncbi:peptidyl-prolyl isomerase cwc27 [Sesbania bispinosa]|nr:peptidyl-prolyl isomerase cwc27 [Sesbania bispinosa]
MVLRTRNGELTVRGAGCGCAAAAWSNAGERNSDDNSFFIGLNPNPISLSHFHSCCAAVPFSLVAPPTTSTVPLRPQFCLPRRLPQLFTDHLLCSSSPVCLPRQSPHQNDVVRRSAFDAAALVPASALPSTSLHPFAVRRAQVCSPPCPGVQFAQTALSFRASAFKR